MRRYNEKRSGSSTSKRPSGCEQCQSEYKIRDYLGLMAMLVWTLLALAYVPALREPHSRFLSPLFFTLLSSRLLPLVINIELPRRKGNPRGNIGTASIWYILWVRVQNLQAAPPRGKGNLAKGSKRDSCRRTQGCDTPVGVFRPFWYSSTTTMTTSELFLIRETEKAGEL